MSDQDSIISKLKSEFSSLYRESPERVFFAPGRVNLIGEHTDYNGGHVFPCALTLGTYAAVAPRNDRQVRFASLNMNRGSFRDLSFKEFSIDDFTRSDSMQWTDYPRGVIWAICQAGFSFAHGMDVMYYGNIPSGSGLSSSASLEVLTALAIREVYGFEKISQVELALFGQKAENEFVGMNCGIMDQFASAMGKENHAIFLDTDNLTYTYAPLELDNKSIVITNSNVKHQLASSAYNIRRSECEKALKRLRAVRDIGSLCELTPAQFEELRYAISDPVAEKRAKHAITENQRTIDAVEALNKHDIAAFGKLMNESHISIRDDFEASCPETDYLAELAWNVRGVSGSRITGGGYGGCTVSIVENDSIEAFQKTLYEKYLEKFSLKAEFYTVKPGEGARELFS